MWYHGPIRQYVSAKEIQHFYSIAEALNQSPFRINLKDDQILLINTNVKHSLSDSAYNNRRAVCEKVAAMLNVKALRDVSESGPGPR